MHAITGRTAADSLVGPPAPTDDADGTVGPPVPTEDDMVGPPVPAEDAEDMVGPVAPADYNGGVGLGEDDEESDPYSLPISHEASLQGGAPHMCLSAAWSSGRTARGGALC